MGGSLRIARSAGIASGLDLGRSLLFRPGLSLPMIRGGSVVLFLHECQFGQGGGILPKDDGFFGPSIADAGPLYDTFQFITLKISGCSSGTRIL